LRLTPKEFALMLDDLRPMPIIKQIMIYNRRSESDILPEYLEMVVSINRNMSALFDELFYCDDNISQSDKLKLYRSMMCLLDELKSNFLKPIKFNPVFDFIENFVLRHYNFQDKNSPFSVLYETLKDHIVSN